MTVVSNINLLSNEQLRGVCTAICIRLDADATQEFSVVNEFEVSCLVEYLVRTSDNKDMTHTSEELDPVELFN